ncbi:MAG TPA: hypothetical protein PK986_01455 [Spirochaetota bacterium]|nr:hypothetical protein [Spirochaetota bacterium]
MAKPQEKDQQDQKLPESKLILVNEKGKLIVKSLDDYSDKMQIQRIYEGAIEKHGLENVRLCSVVPVHIETRISFDI